MTAVFYRYHHSGSLAGQTKQPSLARAQAQGPGPPQDRQKSLPACQAIIYSPEALQTTGRAVARFGTGT